MNGLNIGSTWHRCEPHLHAPGTLFNNQFKEQDVWNSFLDRLERADPKIRSLGVTDYYLTDLYERVREEKQNGRLPDVELLFPNIEVRLDISTAKNHWVNAHLLVSPEHEDHIAQIRRFLARLRFRAHGDTFSCTPEEFVRLGKAADRSITDEHAALRHGAGQFKVGFDQLREEFDKSDWARSNVLVAVAGSESDGTSGIRDGADATLREEIEAFADIIFASSPAQREFWLGRRALSAHQVCVRYGGLKPCLHGSDGHSLDTVGVPDNERYCWIKGGVEFDALRQACIDPAGRAAVGPTPPEHGAPSQLIDRIDISGASWALTPSIGLNPSLVAIIGARGSGKTALADMIALACDAVPARTFDQGARPHSSFLARARELLAGAQVTVHWKTGYPCTRALDGSDKPDVTYPRARYLSQQFVEELCSSSGLTDELLREIERVIYESHPLSERDGTVDFGELLDLRASRHRLAREREQAALVQLSERIGAELEKDRLLPTLNKDLEAKRKQLDAHAADRAKLITPGSEDRVRRLTELMDAVEAVRTDLAFFNNQEQALLALQDEVYDLRQNQAPEMLRRSKDRHSASRMKAEEWDAFLLDYTGDVDSQIAAILKKAREGAARRRGQAPKPLDDPNATYISTDIDLRSHSLAVLEAEINRLQKQVSADMAVQRQFAALSKKIAEEAAALQALGEKAQDAAGAKERARELQNEREQAYTRVFEAIVAEQGILHSLYQPLTNRIEQASGTLQKLTFTVARVADVAAWCAIAEDELLDLRRQGPFKGKGSLQLAAEELLLSPWATGSPGDVREAMQAFRDRYYADLLKHANVVSGDPSEQRSWLKRFAKWLYSTDHIRLQYDIRYGDVDIRKLSPGTRGIVLLLLYLALDDADDRPLIIDQPEENLDPKSVFDELVGLFVTAKQKRQVIIVTHNANLVVNTDADQIIVASAGSHAHGELPPITYYSGGMENRTIRKHLCDILEGGESAFQERARRLRVTLEGHRQRIESATGPRA